jgi:hypothetical protein
LAYANEHRLRELYQSVFQSLYQRCQQVAGKGRRFRLRNPRIILDTTMIDLCASVFDWAKYKRTKGVVKLHLLLDQQGYLPRFVVITPGNVQEIEVGRKLHFEPGTILVMDRGYVDSEWYERLTQQGVFLVTRVRADARFQMEEERPVPQRGHILRDQIIHLGSHWYGQTHRLRRLEVEIPDQTEPLLLLTNHLDFSPTTVARLYRERWQIGVPSQGHIVQSVKDRPRPKDSGLVAGEAPWRESKTAEPSDNMLGKEYAQRTKLQCAVNADVASLHESPVTETIDNARKQQELAETSPRRQLLPAGYQRRHGVKEDVETGEALGARRRNLVEEMPAITVSGKRRHRHQGDGSGCSTVNGRAAKRARREGPGPVSTPLTKVRQG